MFKLNSLTPHSILSLKLKFNLAVGSLFLCYWVLNISWFILNGMFLHNLELVISLIFNSFFSYLNFFANSSLFWREFFSNLGTVGGMNWRGNVALHYLLNNFGNLVVSFDYYILAYVKSDLTLSSFTSVFIITCD